MTIDEIVAQSRASQNKVELAMVLRFMVPQHPKVVVEIGLHKGYSLLDWFRAFQPDLMIGIEKDISQLDQEAIDEISKGCDLHIVEGDSMNEEIQRKVRHILSGRFIDFLYIDGDHSYKAVESDFKNYALFVRTGGVVGFDDIMLTGYKWESAGVEVNRFWLDLTAVGGTQSYVMWDQEKRAGFGSGDGLWVKPKPPKQPIQPVIGQPQMPSIYDKP